MTTAACSLTADELGAQLDRYRVLGRHAAAVDYEPGRVLVRFADDPPRPLIERTLEVERGCCPFFEVDYQPAGRRLAIGVDQPNRRPNLDAIARALGESRGADLLPDTARQGAPIVPGPAGCCNPALETCCEPKHKQECCGQPLSGGSTVAAPPNCGCDA
jgi:hypothetical protein